ncbi:MAG: hypothetical protein EBV19_10515, partial [Flavobacteriia bacterium]|nr:hypothetical protein [Flavobacteriia bacterium]
MFDSAAPAEIVIESRAVELKFEVRNTLSRSRMRAKVEPLSEVPARFAVSPADEKPRVTESALRYLARPAAEKPRVTES